MTKKTIKKTLKLKIVRPYNSKEIEAEVVNKKTEKENKAIKSFEGKLKQACSYHLKCVNYCNEKVERKNCRFCQAKQLDERFIKELKQKYPEAIFWGELSEIFRQLQKQISETYNHSISELYHEIFLEEKGRVGENSLDFYLSDVCYPRVYELLKNSYLALGLRQKIKSNFRLKELKRMESALPTAKSDNFPIPFFKQKDGSNPGFKIENIGEDFIIELPFGRWKPKQIVDKYRPWERYDFAPIQKDKKSVKLLLSTKRRKSNNGWLKDEGTDSEIRRIMNGELKVSSLEIKKGKKIGEKNIWMLNIVADIPVPQRNIDENIIGGVDVGVKNPLVSAIFGSPARYSINDNDLYKFNRKMFARRRILLKKNRHKRAGHGSKNKLKPITILTEKSERFRKKLMERWACELADFFIKNNTGTVQMENLESLKLKEDNYFNLRLRGYWPYARMQDIIEFKLSQQGIKVKYIEPKNTSKTCSKCGFINEHFTFEYRKKHKFPDFKCANCGFSANADHNAALNISNPKLKETKK